MWLPDEGRFGAKLRELDDVKTGPEAVQRMRSEWEKRVNAELEKAGVEERVDPRSYEAMAATGDAPDGLMAQRKLGARNTARGRKRKGGATSHEIAAWSGHESIKEVEHYTRGVNRKNLLKRSVLITGKFDYDG